MTLQSSSMDRSSGLEHRHRIKVFGRHYNRIILRLRRATIAKIQHLGTATGVPVASSTLETRRRMSLYYYNYDAY